MKILAWRKQQYNKGFNFCVVLSPSLLYGITHCNQKAALFFPILCSEGHWYTGQVQVLIVQEAVTHFIPLYIAWDAIKQSRTWKTCHKTFRSKIFLYDFSQNLAEMIDTSTNWLQSSKKMCKLLLRHQDPVLSCNLLRSFLILWKQLEMLKAEWGRLKLRTEDINTVPLYKEFCEQYG